MMVLKRWFLTRNWGDGGGGGLIKRRTNGGGYELQ